MDAREVIEVYRAKNGAQAHIFAQKLREAGIQAQVQGDVGQTLSQTATSLLSSASVWWDAPRILVFTDEADQARTLLQELESREVERENPPPSGMTIAVKCEECGEVSDFPLAQQGTVQVCPKCDAYIDVEAESNS